MGNHMSCISPSAVQRASHCSKNLIKFLHFETGAISDLKVPLTAAEAMMEFPSQFLCCFLSVLSSSNGRRICAVPADEELLVAELYILIPMHKLNTCFAAEDVAFVAALASQSSTAGKQSSKGAISQSKITPLPASISEGLSIAGSLSFKQLDAGPVNMNFQGPSSLCRMGSNHMMCRSKSWIPKLETITEAAAMDVYRTVNRVRTLDSSALAF